jgi:hypothetical protein
VFLPGRVSPKCSAMGPPKPNRSYNSRARMRAAIRGDPRSLEVYFQRSVKRELKRVILFLTHSVLSSRGSPSHCNLHN